MQDDQNQAQNPNPAVTQPPVPQPQVPQPQMPDVNQVGSFQKEAPYFSKDVTGLETQIQEVDKAPEVSQELRDIGVEAKTERPELNNSHAEVGIKPAGDSVPVVLPKPASHGFSNMAATEAEAKAMLKDGHNPLASFTWLLTSLIRQMKIKRLKNATA